MAYSISQERQGLATSLREDLNQAERLIVQLRRHNVEQFLLLLDQIEDNFIQLEDSGLDLRPEYTRWASLQSKLRSEAGRVVRVAKLAGGIAQLRQDNPPAEGQWWRLDDVVAAARRRMVRRIGMTTGVIAALLAIVWALLTFVFPPDPNTVVASEALSALQQLAFEGRWEEALSAIEEAKLQLTQPNAELLVWEGVIHDKLGQTERAAEVLAEAKSLVPENRLVSYLWTLGSIRLAVGDLEEARNAGRQAIEFDPTDAQGYFLLAGAAEAEGDTRCAVDLFDKSFELAADDNPQLAVIARVRMGQLLQRPANLSPFAAAESENGDQQTAGSNGEPVPCEGL